jgi:hypothetical protein
MGKLGKTPRAEHQQTPRKTRELYVNVRRGLRRTDTQQDRVLKEKKKKKKKKKKTLYFATLNMRFLKVFDGNLTLMVLKKARPKFVVS